MAIAIAAEDRARIAAEAAEAARRIWRSNVDGMKELGYGASNSEDEDGEEE
jgi:hypothetical protein